MATDWTDKESFEGRPDLWQLPKILSVEARHVRYEEPQVRYVRTERVEHREAVEILVEASAGLPPRSIPPVLFVGNSPVGDYEALGDNHYRFYVFDFEKLEEGAPISLGWPQAPTVRQGSEFRFELAGKVQE